jgi:hypothetical protein
VVRAGKRQEGCTDRVQLGSAAALLQLLVSAVMFMSGSTVEVHLGAAVVL